MQSENVYSYMNRSVAQHFCIVKGFGVDDYAIASFDKALLMAGVGDYNLVRVSSIMPPLCKQIKCVSQKKGSILFTAYAYQNTDCEEQIASAIAAAITENGNESGVIMEYSCIGNKEYAIRIASQLVKEAMERRNIENYHIISDGIEAVGYKGKITTTFAAIALV